MKQNSSEIKSFFDDFADIYNWMAFNFSLGIKYLDLMERKFIKENLPFQKEQRLLDLGIGTGRNSSLFLREKVKIYGIDISSKMLKIASKQLKNENVELILADISKKLPFSDQCFDGVICFRVLKYLKNWPETIREISRITKKGGYLALSISNMFSVQSLSLLRANYTVFNPFLLEKELKENKFKILKIGQGSRLPFFLYQKIQSPKTLRAVIKIENFLKLILPKRFLPRALFYLCQKAN